jgi:Flp pilus assembly protein TadG
MNRTAREARPLAEPPQPRSTHPRGAAGWRSAHGSLSMEAVLILPVIALLVVGLLQVAAIVSDVLLVHEAARAGARAAATSTDSESVVRAATEAAPELDGMVVRVEPQVRRDGDIARVEVSVVRTIGPVSHTLRATAHTRVEPSVGTTRREGVP